MKKTTTRRALFMSFVSLLLCMSMLLGTTYAWFTDSVTSSANMIVAGNLDVELEYKNVIDGAAATDWSPVTTDTDDLFDKNALWEPGHTEVAYLKVSNLGSLNLKYQLSVRVAEEIAGTNVAGESFKLSDYLVFTVVDLDESEIGTIDRAAAKAAGNTMGFDDYNGTIKALDAKDGNVVDADYVALIVYMPETVGNEANYKVGTTAPQIKLGINLFATQVEAEKDSFDEFYDKESPIVSTSVSAAIPAAGTTATENKVIETTVENNVALTLSAEFLNTFAALYEDEAVEAPKSVAVSHSEPKIDTANKTVTFENIDLVDENGNVIDLEDLGNDKPITVKFNVGDAFEVGQTVLVYHNGEVVASPAVDANKNITYTVTHFCEVAVAFNDGKIDTAKEFLATVAAVEDGDVITLAGDIVFNKEDRSWNSGTWYDGLYYIGDKSFTIDLAGYTIISKISRYFSHFFRIMRKIIIKKKGRKYACRESIPPRKRGKLRKEVCLRAKSALR